MGQEEDDGDEAYDAGEVELVGTMRVYHLVGFSRQPREKVVRRQCWKGGKKFKINLLALLSRHDPEADARTC